MTLRWCVLFVSLLAPALLAGCTSGASPFTVSKDPVGASTFQDAGTNTTTWSLLVAGHFHLPHGTRFTIEANNKTCTTPGLTEKSANKTLGCRTEDARQDRYRVLILDQDGDGRTSQNDRIEIRPGPAHENTTFHGPHRMILSLHPEIPLFVLEQGFGPEGPKGPLAVELMG